MTAWVEIGRVLSVNPAKRQLRVKPFTGTKVELNNVETCQVRLLDGTIVRAKVTNARDTSREWLFELGAGTRRETVASCQRGTVRVEPNAMPLPTDGAPEALALIGWHVVGLNDAEIGRVVEAMDTPAHGVLTIECPDGGELLLPLVPEVLADVDFDAETLYVHDITPFAVINGLEDDDAD